MSALNHEKTKSTDIKSKRPSSKTTSPPPPKASHIALLEGNMGRFRPILLFWRPKLLPPLHQNRPILPFQKGNMGRNRPILPSRRAIWDEFGQRRALWDGLAPSHGALPYYLCSLSKEQSILSRETIQNAIFSGLYSFYDLDFILYHGT